MPIPPLSPQADKESLNDLALLVRNHDADWQSAWASLAEALVPQLRSYIGARAGQLPGGAALLEDMVSEVFVYWQKRVNAGTLLRQWDPSVPVAGYLCGRATVHMARKFAQRVSQPGIGGEDGMAIMDSQAAHMQAQQSGDAEDILPPEGEPAPALNHSKACYFLPLPENGVGKMHLMAAVQLFPHINWQQSPAPEVAQALPHHLKGLDQDNWAQELVAAHRQAQARLAQQEQAKREQMSNNGKGVTPRKQKILQAQIIKLRSEQYIRPLDAQTLMQLTGAQRNSCDQDRSRYARNWQAIVAWEEGHMLAPASSAKGGVA